MLRIIDRVAMFRGWVLHWVMHDKFDDDTLLDMDATGVMKIIRMMLNRHTENVNDDGCREFQLVVGM